MRKNILIFYSLGKKTGLGHFTRCKTLSDYLSKENFKSYLIRLDDEFKKKNIYKFIYNKIKNKKAKIVIFDTNKKFLNQKFKKLLINLKKQKINLIGIDNLRSLHKYFNLIWIPSFYLGSKYKYSNIVYGWDKFLLNPKKNNYKANKKIFVLTGGSENKFLSNKLPKILDSKIPKKYKLIWVQGKYSIKPKLTKPTNRWKILKNPKSYLGLLSKAGYVLTTYGMSFYESISLGLPTVCYPNGMNKIKDMHELKKLKNLKIALVENNYLSAVNQLCNLLKDKKKTYLLSRNSKKKFNKKGLSIFKNYLNKL